MDPWTFPSPARLVGPVVAAGALLLLAACGSTGRAPVQAETSLGSPSAGSRMAGLRQVAWTRDRARIPEVIELLDDPDPGVRLMAGAVLSDLSGRETGYGAHEGPVERRQQVLAWRAWWAGETAGGRGAPAAGPAVGAPVPPGTTLVPVQAVPPPPPPPPPSGDVR